MDYGICNLNIVPLRSKPSDKSELVSQVLFGEHFKILAIHKKWSKIHLAFDGYKGWIDNEQFLIISKKQYHSLENKSPVLVGNTIDFVTDKNQVLSTNYNGGNFTQL